MTKLSRSATLSPRFSPAQLDHHWGMLRRGRSVHAGNVDADKRGRAIRRRDQHVLKRFLATVSYHEREDYRGVVRRQRLDGGRQCFVRFLGPVVQHIGCDDRVKACSPTLTQGRNVWLVAPAKLGNGRSSTARAVDLDIPRERCERGGLLPAAAL
eukprot:3431080-Prymnesium_polylepis.2